MYAPHLADPDIQFGLVGVALFLLRRQALSREKR
jgi:hypothetical protein